MVIVVDEASHVAIYVPRFPENHGILPPVADIRTAEEVGSANDQLQKVRKNKVTWHRHFTQPQPSTDLTALSAARLHSLA